MKHQKADTRGRLLDAARDIFYNHGYQKATIQMIASEADANIAAVNYHYRDKASLLAVVLSQELGEMRKSMPRISDNPKRPEKVLKDFVAWFFARYEEGSKVAPLLQEVSYGGDVFESMMNDVVRPETEALSGILQALDPKSKMEDIQRRTVCLMALMVHSVRYTPLIPTMFADCQISDDAPSAWAKHITDVALNGMKKSA